MKILKQNNVKGTLTSAEKRRFQQIGDQFFKGSYEFFVHYQETIHKTVDINIINNNFVQYFQNQLKDAKEKLIDKAQILEQEKAKEKFQNRLLNFIIALQVGFIAFLKLPMSFQKIKEYAQKTLDGVAAGVELLKNSAGAWVDLLFWLCSGYSSIMEDVYKSYLNFAKHVVYYFKYFFFESYTFTECFKHLGLKIGNRATGAIGLLFDIVKKIYTVEIYKRPKLKHWLLYGVDQAQRVKSLESEYFNNLNSFESSGWFFGDDFQFGAIIDGEYQGVVEGEAVKDNTGKTYEELQSIDIKKELELFQNKIQQGAEEVSGEYTVNSLYGVPNLLKSKTYIELQKRWEEIKNKEVNISGTIGDVPLHEIFFNPFSNDEQSETIKIDELKNSYNEIKLFYEKYKNSKDPFAKSICDEIRDKFLSAKFESFPIDKNNKGNYISLKAYMFIPAIQYAIIQFQFVQERNEKLIASMERRLSKLNAELEFYVKDRDLNDYRKKEQKFVNGQISFSQFAQEIAKDFTNFKFTMPKIDIEKHLTFEKLARKTKDVITEGVTSILNVASKNVKFNALNFIKVSENDLDTFGEIKVGNSHEMVKDITTNYVVVKTDLRNTYQQRQNLILQILKLFANKQGAFVIPNERKLENLNKKLELLKKREKREIDKIEKNDELSRREKSIAKVTTYQKYGAIEKKINKKRDELIEKINNINNGRAR